MRSMGLYDTNKADDVMVVGLITPNVYLSYNKNVGEAWDRTHPGWRELPVVYVQYKVPRQNLTYDEYKFFNLEMPDEVARWNYDNLPKTQCHAVPFDQAVDLLDLETNND